MIRVIVYSDSYAEVYVTGNATDFQLSVDAMQQAFVSVRQQVLSAAGAKVFASKVDGTPQTSADVDAEKAIFTYIKEKSPGIPVFGEESGYSDGLPGTCWLIDSIDGTKSLLEGVPAYTGMAALLHKDEVVASVIYNYQLDDMYVTQQGKGAYKNGQRLDLSAVDMPRKAFCRERMVGAVSDMFKSTGVVFEAGYSGAGYGFSLVADGSVAARFNFPHVPGGGYVHDYAPGALLVREAGGSIIAIEEGRYTYKTRSFVACHPELAPAVRERVKELRRLELQTAAY